jgi:hypothetical protein
LEGHLLNVLKNMKICWIELWVVRSLILMILADSELEKLILTLRLKLVDLTRLIWMKMSVKCCKNVGRDSPIQKVKRPREKLVKNSLKKPDVYLSCKSKES